MGTFMASLGTDALDLFFRRKLTQQTRDAVAERLAHWLDAETRVLPVPDLAERREAFKKRIRDMCQSFSVEAVDGRFQVRVAGAHADTLSLLRRGSNWFAGLDEVEDLIVAAVLRSELRT